MTNKLLVVDDEEGIREILEITLTDAGYDVLTAENGFAGLDMVKTHKPDIVLTDIRMPGMDGMALLKSVKQLFPDIEVIMITGYGDANLAIESLKTGAVDFISKPVNQDVLDIALKRANDRILTREKLADHTRNLEFLVAEKTRKLAESEKRYIQLFNESPAYISILDQHFRIVESNNRFKDQFGDDPDMYCFQVQQQHTSPCDTCPVKETFADGRSHTAEMDVTLKDGHIRRFFIQTSAIPDDSGRISHVMEMCTDITVIHDLQDHLAALGLHISSISHGIKGMLTGLDGGDYLIRSGLEQKDFHKIANGWDIIREKIAMIRQMVLDILFHSKNRTPDMQPVSVFDFIQELLTTMDPRIQKAGIDLILDIPSPSTDFDVMMDKTMLFGACLAILENAVDACISVKGVRKKLEIQIQVVETLRQVVFKIRDNGKGLDKRYRQRIFSLFYSDKGNKGTGLGLFVARRSVQQHQGEIQVDSEPGKFTEFTIAIPKKTSDI
ncbi:MAG: response regulator [Desulfotignum sp.]|nr:response regulator [Desulfotignum sp.]MCF8087352.1 response regulator [Desulfotignum sp.]MCF8135710.1 response regulator [Desulfotignum sp.]